MRAAIGRGDAVARLAPSCDRPCRCDIDAFHRHRRGRDGVGPLCRKATAPVVCRLDDSVGHRCRRAARDAPALSRSGAFRCTSIALPFHSILDTDSCASVDSRETSNPERSIRGRPSPRRDQISGPGSMAAVMAHSMSKRKRDTHDMPNVRAAPGMGTNDGSDFTQQYLHTDDDGMDAADTNMDFAAVLAQHNGGPQQSAEQAQHDAQAHPQQRSQAQVQGPHRPGQSASDTATAALAQYHTMTVPQPTEQSFMNQPTENGNRAVEQTPTSQHRNSSFGDMDFNAMKENQQPTDGDSSPNNAGGQQTPSQNKPAVGTDEWHKVRRDNHKEGKSCLPHASTLPPLQNISLPHANSPPKSRAPKTRDDQ